MLDGTARSPGLCVRGCLRLAVACGQCGAVRCDPGPLRHPQSPFGVPKCSVFTVLSSLVVNRTADAIELSNGITVEVRAASFRRLCGVTCVAVIASEAAFWLDEMSANADVEIFNAGKYETAAALLRDRILLVPGTDFSRVLLASALGHLGEGDEARRIWQELEQINPKYSFSEHFARQPFKKEEDVQRIAEGLAKAGLST
jgi:hypothetical protein